MEQKTQQNRMGHRPVFFLGFPVVIVMIFDGVLLECQVVCPKSRRYPSPVDNVSENDRSTSDQQELKFYEKLSQWSYLYWE
jgi:hypothetical protein